MGKIKYLRRKRTSIAYVSVVLPATGIEILLPLSNAPMFYSLKTKPNIQHRQEIMYANQVLASKEKYRSLIVRLSTINPAYQLWYRYRTRSGFTYFKQTQRWTLTWNQERDTSTSAESELLPSKCSSFYHQSIVETSLPLPNAFRFYELKTHPRIQLWQEIRGEKQVRAPKEKYWHLFSRRSTINPA